MYDKPAANIILKDKRIKAFPLKLKKISKWCPLLLPLFSMFLKVLARGIKYEKEIKDIQNRKEELKLSF